MKMNKFFAVALAATTLFASCAKEETPATSNGDKTQLVIKLADNGAATRALEAPGKTEAGTIDLTTNSHIFVLNPTGGVIHHEALKASEAETPTGQILMADATNPKLVASDSRVFILGNIPAADLATISALTNFTAIQAAVSSITTQSAYATAALANSDGQPAAISLRTAATTTDPAIYEASITLTPLISRVELLAIQGDADITAFNVAGVYVDNYYPQFTYAGSGAGTMFELEQETSYDGDAFYKTEGTPVPAVDVNGKFTARFTNQVWAFNVASKGAPRLIIKLTGVKYMDGLTEVTLGDRWLTVTGYNSGALTDFVRGKIYRIGTNDQLVTGGLIDAADNGTVPFEFGVDDLGLTPNPIDVELYVSVSISEWDVELPVADL
jgi:hypothetical protein